MPDSSPRMTLSLNAFVRYYATDQTKLAGEIRRRVQTPGGYDYYRILGDAIRAKINGSSDDEINYILSGSSNISEQANNRAAYEVYLSKFGNKNGMEVFEKKGRVSLCEGELVVHVNPIFSLNSSSGFQVFNVWATRSPEIDRTRAAVGVYLAQQAFKKSAPNYTYKFFNCVDGKTYGSIMKDTQRAVEMHARNIISYARG